MIIGQDVTESRAPSLKRTVSKRCVYSLSLCSEHRLTANLSLSLSFTYTMLIRHESQQLQESKHSMSESHHQLPTKISTRLPRTSLHEGHSDNALEV